MSFHIHKFETRFRPGEDGKMMGTDWVTYSPIGRANNAKTNARVKDLLAVQALEQYGDNSAIIMAHERKGIIESAYESWKSGQEAPVDGTPLGAWPALSPGQADAIRAMGIRSVEEVRDATDSVQRKLPVNNVRDLVKQASMFLKSIDRAAVTDDLSRKDAEIAALKADMEEMRQMMLAEAAEKEDAPKKRGRPPRVVAPEDNHTDG